MSTLIDTVKALDAVRRCCRGTTPQGKIIGLLDQIVDAFSPPLEAGMVKIPVGPIIQFLARPGPAPGIKLPYLPRLEIGKIDISETIKEQAQQAREEARKLDPCELLLGCVAREFRLLSLPQGQSSRRDRIRYIEYDWVSHYFLRSPGRVPAGYQRYVRQRK